MPSHVRPVFAHSSLAPVDVGSLAVRLREVTARQEDGSPEDAQQPPQLRITARAALSPGGALPYTIVARATVGPHATIECRFEVDARFLAEPSPALLAHPRSLEVIKQMAWPAVGQCTQHLAAIVTVGQRVLGPAAGPPPRRSLVSRLRRWGGEGRP